MNSITSAVRKENEDLVPYRVEVYIGSDNDSRKICESYLKKVKEWADATFPEGYTLLRGEGCYKGLSEDSILINSLSLYDISIQHRLKELKQDLKQESILIVKSVVEYELI